MDWVYDDAGLPRVPGCKDYFRDCAIRAISIAIERPIEEVAAELQKRVAAAWVGDEPWFVFSDGVPRFAWNDYLTELGFVRRDGPPLPTGHLLVEQSVHEGHNHLVAVIDDVAHDVFDPRELPVKAYWIEDAS